MATGTAYTPNNDTIYSIVVNHESTGTNGLFNVDISSVAKASILKENIVRLYNEQSLRALESESQKINKKFIKLHNSFDKQILNLQDYYSAYSVQFIKQVLSDTASSLFDYEPDVLSIQITYDHSLFFTFKKGLYSVYYELFFKQNLNEIDEIVITVFQSDVNSKNFAGTLDESNFFLSNLFSTNQDVAYPTMEYALS